MGFGWTFVHQGGFGWSWANLGGLGWIWTDLVEIYVDVGCSREEPREMVM